MHQLLALSRVIDAITTRLGKWISWLVFAVVLIAIGLQMLTSARRRLRRERREQLSLAAGAP